MSTQTITSLALTNFQSHKDTRLEFAPGLNVIVGPSDVGKSAVIRALRWIVFNRPSGESFRSEWGGDTQAMIRLSSGAGVRRARSSKLNQYGTQLPDGSGGLIEAEYNAIKTEVPPEVAEAHGLGELNFQQQHDAPFAISMTAGALARALNEVVDLSAIDLALSTGAREVRKNREALDVVERDGRALAGAVAALEPVVAAAGVAAGEVRVCDKRLDTLFDEIAHLENTLILRTANAERVSELSELLRNVTDCEHEVTTRSTEAQEARGVVLEYTAQYHLLDELVSKVADEWATRQTYRTAYERGLTARVLTRELAIEFDAAYRHAANLADTVSKLGNSVEWYHTMHQGIAHRVNEAKAAAEAYNKALKDAGVCPTCKRTL